MQVTISLILILVRPYVKGIYIWIDKYTYEIVNQSMPTKLYRIVYKLDYHNIKQLDNEFNWLSINEACECTFNLVSATVQIYHSLT